MKKYRPRFSQSGPTNYAAAGNPDTSLSRMPPLRLNRNFRFLLVLLVAVFVTNAGSHLFFNPKVDKYSPLPHQIVPGPPPAEQLYLMDKASLFVSETMLFEQKVREIAAMLRVAPEWLMAVMYSESKFDAGVLNYKGSGATGLIQFMPAAASELNVSLPELQQMGHLEQMEYVYRYLANVRERYGDFTSLTDLYLAILYPRACKQDYCYTLYAKPSKSYSQNSGLDENKDGRVTVSDIDRRMQRLYPTAYQAPSPLHAEIMPAAR